MTAADKRITFHKEIITKKFRALGLVTMMFFVSLATLSFASWEAQASVDQDGDGLPYGLEYLINTQPQSWDSDGDGMPDGWEWKYGLDPLDASTLGDNGATGDPDGDNLPNLQEYEYGMSATWDNTATPDKLDNGVWWNGTVPVNGWDEENSMQYSQPLCGDVGSDGTGNIVLCDEDPVGNICTDGFDNDGDGLEDSTDPDRDGDADCSSNDDDGDGIADEDPAGWDTDGDGMDDGWEVANQLDPTSPNGPDGAYGDPDSDGLFNIYEYINPSWDTVDFIPGPDLNIMTKTESPCNPVLLLGPSGCVGFTAEVDGNTETNPQAPDSDGDGLNDSFEALILLTDPTAIDTDGDNITDFIEVNSNYGGQQTDPLDNNTDDDNWDDGVEDANADGQINGNETDPTRREDIGDFDGDGIENWEENLTCTDWDEIDTDFGGVSDLHEQLFMFNTDPCDSLVNFVTTQVSFSGVPPAGVLTVADSSGFNPDGGNATYESGGVYTQFTFSGVAGNDLTGVDLAPPTLSHNVVARDGSWCYGTDGTNRELYCDDDYADLDNDGLANWQENLSGSSFNNPDTDNDGQFDGQEVENGTDTNEPCDNTLDSDGDQINDYIEANPGCLLSFIDESLGNSTTDPYTTDPTLADSDNGGVEDGDEYFDGTDPTDPFDDVNQQDTDGDGLPDVVENATGTSWQLWDSDGGGMSDGAECPNGVCTSFDPWDPTDDVTTSDVLFWANSTSGTVDASINHYWRVVTHVNYTGAGYAPDTSNTYETMVAPYSNNTWIADSQYINDTVNWQITYNAISGNLPLPANWNGMTFWDDPGASMFRQIFTGTTFGSGAPITQTLVSQPEIYFEQSELDASVPFPGHLQELSLPSYFTDPLEIESEVNTLTAQVLSDAGVSSGSAYEKAEAIADYLSDDATFKINFNGSGVPDNDDMVHHMLTISNQGLCSEYVSAFVTMSRLAGLPARWVQGYRNGAWDGTGYEVTSLYGSAWGEVHLQENGRDMGWVTFQPCPSQSVMSVTNETWSPSEFDRDGSTDIFIEGDFIFESNQSAAPGIILKAYLVPTDEAASAPGIPTPATRQIGLPVTTDSLGHFIITGKPSAPIQPGHHKIVIEHMRNGFVPTDAFTFDWFINVTDDSIITHQSPGPSNSPEIGAGATVDIEGIIDLENTPSYDISQLGTLSMYLNYTDINGPQNLVTTVGEGGFWSFTVTIDVTQPESQFAGLLPATVEFGGWVDESQAGIDAPTSGYHLRPSTLNIGFNISQAPEIIATLQGPGSDNSIIIVDDVIYLNGTTNSLGAGLPLAGIVSVSMKVNQSSDIPREVLNKSVPGGAFSVSEFINAATILTIPAGEVEFRVIFYPNTLVTTSSADVGDGYTLKSKMNFEFITTPKERGELNTVSIQVTDHRGESVGVDFSGDYQHWFNGAQVDSETDPSNPMQAEWTTAIDLLPGDYTFETRFLGSELFAPSDGNTSLIVQGTPEFDASPSSDWTHVFDSFGNMNQIYIVGDMKDNQALGGPFVVTGNDTNITLTMNLPDSGEGESGSSIAGYGAVDTVTGEFNVSFTLPFGTRAGEYTIEIAAIYDQNTTEPYYLNPDPVEITYGVSSDSSLARYSNISLLETSNPTVIAGDVLTFFIGAIDVGDDGFIGAQTFTGIFDYGNTDQVIPSSKSFLDLTTDAESGSDFWDANTAVFQYPIPAGTAPGTYMIEITYLTNNTYNLGDDSPGSRTYPGRWTGDVMYFNVTVQVDSAITLSYVQPEVIAGQSFIIEGTIQDAVDPNRPVSGPFEVNVWFIDDDTELLLAGSLTNASGTFNLSVPTDPALDGTAHGNRNFRVEVINGSSPFYLDSTVDDVTHVTGTTQFVELNHQGTIILRRGDTIQMNATLVEPSLSCPACAFDAPIDTRVGSATVAAKFHDTWLSELSTSSTGEVSFSYILPLSQPLGTVTLTLMFNGTPDLQSTVGQFPNTVVQSVTVLVIDNIDPAITNPVAGETFAISGSISSDNGSALMNRDGTPLSAQLIIEIDNSSNLFSVSGGMVDPSGQWNATLTLDSNFEAGLHEIQVTYVSTINAYLGSESDSELFTRGFAILVYEEPGNLEAGDRTVRGDNLTVSLSVTDNAGNLMEGASIDIKIMELGPSSEITTTTDASGIANVTFQIPTDMPPGEITIYSDWDGILGPTGIEPGFVSTKVVILARPVLTVDSVQRVSWTLSNGTQVNELVVAGENITISGYLLDDLGQALLSDNNTLAPPQGGVINLYVDGVFVGSTVSDNITGFYELSYELPDDTFAGIHVVHVEFRGGFFWVDPMGSGDSTNPEYYLDSVSEDFNVSVSVPTEIKVTTPDNGEVNREGTVVINGTLVDLVQRQLVGASIDVSLDGQVFTTVTTDAEGRFQIIYVVPEDSELGEIEFAIRFNGDLYNLSTDSTSKWFVFSLINITIDQIEPHAVGEQVTFSGVVSDNLLLGIENHQVTVYFDGVDIGTTNTSLGGAWTFDYNIPLGTDWGEHSVEVRAAEQPYYRAGDGATTMYVAHHSSISITVSEFDVNRGDYWNLSGKLIDSDDPGSVGIGDVPVDLLIDGVFVTSIVTGADGFWSYQLLVDQSADRGEHNLEIIFNGTISHVGSQNNLTVNAWSDITMFIDEAQSSIEVVRSENNALLIIGSITEVGGASQLIYNEDYVISIVTESGTEILPQITWNDVTQNFELSATVPSSLDPGFLGLVITFDGDESEYLRSDSANYTIMLKLNVNFNLELQPIIAGDESTENINGLMRVIAVDTGISVPGLAITVILENESSPGNWTQITSRVLTTDDDGEATVLFESDPAYSDFSLYGNLRIRVETDDERISDSSVQSLENQYGNQGLSLQREDPSSASNFNWQLIVALVLFAVIGIGIYVLKRRSNTDAIKEAQDIISYTAELLASGDDIRMIIFNCYENLCTVLMKYRFLRRDFETVREFEMAIRKALPISDTSLVALDSVFEEARYSRHELTEAHKTQAQEALSNVLAELEKLTDIPAR